MCSLPAFCCCRRRYRSVRRDRLSSASTDWRGDRTTLSIRRSRDLTTLTEQSWPIWDLWSIYHKIRTLDRIDSGYCNESQPFVVVAIFVGCPSTRASAGLAGQPGLCRPGTYRLLWPLLCGYPPTGSVRSLNLLGRFQRVDRQERHLSLRLQLLFTGEYEMPEFDLGNTFNYAAMVALIAPCPFMTERGHHAVSLLTSGWHTKTSSCATLTLVEGLAPERRSSSSAADTKLMAREHLLF